MNQQLRSSEPETKGSHNTERVNSNLKHFTNIRTYGAVNAGILSGILGNDGILGLIIYFVMFMIVSICVLIKCEFNLKKYFISENSVYFGGIGNDILLFLMVWVIFHTLVHVL